MRGNPSKAVGANCKISIAQNILYLFKNRASAVIYIGKLETSPYISVHQRKMIAYQLASHKNVNIIEWGAGTILIWPLPIPLVM